MAKLKAVYMLSISAKGYKTKKISSIPSPRGISNIPQTQSCVKGAAWLCPRYSASAFHSSCRHVHPLDFEREAAICGFWKFLS
jgi:hypothetical protein